VPEPLRVFLDANILSSASFEPNHPFLRFWLEPGIVCLTSFYAADEVRRNARRVGHQERLEVLLEKTHLVSDAAHFRMPAHFGLPGKDQPILAAAIQCGADFLITGDKAHFGKWMNLAIPTPVGELMTMLPKPFLQLLEGG